MRGLLGAILLALLAPPHLPAAGEQITDLTKDFDYFANSWGLIGLKDYPSGCRITPDFHLQLADGVEAEFRFGADGTPLPRGIRRTCWGGLPVVKAFADFGGHLGAVVIVYAVPLPGRPWDYRRRARDEDNFVVVADVSVWNGGQTDAPSARVSVQLTRNGTPIKLTSGSAAGEGVEGGTLRGRVSGRRSPTVTPDGLLTEAGALHRRSGLITTFWLPYRGLPGDRPLLQQADGQFDGDALGCSLRYWRHLLGTESGRVLIPDPKARDTYFASLAYTFIGRDDGSVHPGEGFYDGYFLRDGAYQAWALELAGYLDEARPSVLETLGYQKPDGQFESQGGELDGNGQALWNLWRHYQYTRDRGYLQQAYPAIRRSMAWLAGALRRAPGDPDAAFAGVLPKSWADGEALAKPDYHVIGYDVWNLRGALCALAAARALGETADAGAWAKLAEDYRAALLRLVEKTGVRGFPPSLELDGTDWGNLEIIFPTPLFPPFDRRVSETFAQARQTFVEGTIRWCPKTGNTIHPYMSTFVTNSHVIRGEQQKAVEGLYAFLLHSTSDDGFPEGVYYPSRTAWGDTVPHLWAAAMYVILVRNMLVREDGADLHFASAVPLAWLDAGKEVAFRDAPTTFGRAGLWLKAGADRLDVRLDAPSAERPRRMLLHLPPGIRIASVRALQGHVVRTDADRITLEPQDAYLELAITREPARRVTFESTVRHYLAHAGFPGPQLKGLVTWPLAPEPSRAKYVMLDLRAAANVDPFTAPFGTVNPGKYLFTGLQTGDVVAAGVPFRIIDPKTNGGKAFAVLQGSDTSAGFPREVAIPVGAQGRRIFFLGQVTGWSPSDPGDPKDHTIGEYVLVYQDGTKQTVPLASGVTADDWAMTPMAQRTQIGLRGDPWHLSVLGVTLKPKGLAKIIFRDMGTPASPLLAAVTLEQP